MWWWWSIGLTFSRSLARVAGWLASWLPVIQGGEAQTDRQTSRGAEIKRKNIKKLFFGLPLYNVTQHKT